MDRPIIVSVPLVQPILRDEKVLTSRTFGLEEINEAPTDWEFVRTDFAFDKRFCAGFKRFIPGAAPEWLARIIVSPYGGPGDQLWVRENWYVAKDYDHMKPAQIAKIAKIEKVAVGYIADGPKPEWAGRTRPNIHLPLEFSRCWLKVEAVKLQLLQSITEAEAKLEGVQRGIFREGPNTLKGEFHLETSVNGSPVGDYYDGFKHTWMTLNGRENWDLNPWVWRVYFSRIKP